MKTLYLDCGMGAAGDMLTAALLELLPDPDAFLRELNDLGLPGIRFEKIPSVKCGITGTHISVLIHGEEEESHDHHHHHDHDHDHGHDHGHHHHCHGHHHEHDHEHELAHPHCHEHYDHDHDHDHDHHHHHDCNGLTEIRDIIQALPSVPEAVKEDIIAVYNLIALAESHVHNVPVTEIHFHEVGNLDAIADVAAVCLLMHRLAPEQVVVSPVHVGSGQVRCAHGILPVPAPATAHILREVPIYGGDIRGELCTPTGAALLKHFANRFDSMPPMQVQDIGYGMGKKDFPAANCVRAMMGETAAKAESVLELACNLDDMTGEQLGFAMEQLLTAGALDVYTVPIGMKKSRPATMLRVMCREQDRETMVGLLFRHTTTLGIRESRLERHVLNRQTVACETPWGTVRCKKAEGHGISRCKYEHEDLARIARENDLSLGEILAQLK